MQNRVASRTLRADLTHLPKLQTFVAEQAELATVPAALLPKLELVVEELFLNIVNHAQPRAREDVEVSCTVHEGEESTFCITFQDWGPPFNPLHKDAPTLSEELDERPIGGLGIHLVLQMTDHSEYTRETESNIFTVCFSC